MNIARTYNLEEWRPWQQNASPMLLTLTLNAGMRDLREYFGMALWTSVIIFEENQAKWLFRPKELKLLGQKMIDFLMCPPYRVSFLTGYDNAEEKLLNEAREIHFSLDLGALQNDQLLALFDEYSHTYYSWYKYGWFCEPVQFQSQDILASFLEKEAKKTQPPVDITEATQALFTIEEDSFSVGVLEHLGECAEVLGRALRNYELAREIKGMKSRPGFPSRAAKAVFAVAKRDKDESLKLATDKLKEHSSKFYWKQNNYFSTRFLTEEDILTELFALEGFDLLDPASPIKSQLRQIKENKEKLLSKKATLLELLTPYERNIAVLANSIGGSLLDRRKKTIMISNAAFDRILAEVARRTGVEIGDCRLLIPQELGDFLSAPQEYHHRFEERKKRFLVFQGAFPLLDELFGDIATTAEKKHLTYDTFAMPDPFIAEGQEADRTIEQLNSRLNFLAKAETIAFDKLQGVTTYYDPAEPIIVATARVIKDPKTERLKMGEILFAPSTTPDYADAIRRCSAIVTDWGGQTSHAAIVSRELKKPCIIGTNYASQVLHNGDKVQLDLKQGIVEVLKNT
jgi:phosphohistidine swiveling domain-containing protein